jgi:trimethylamine--corrinoid protein Co-methyltransferase
MRLQPLTESERDLIHDSALRLLEQVGLGVTPALAARLARSGLRVEGDRLLLPRAEVEKALAAAPRRVVLGARDGARAAVLEGERTYVCTDGCGSKVIDFDTGERRPSALRDVAASARLADACDRLDVYWMMVSAQDVPIECRVPREYLTALQNTTKHVQMIDVRHPAEAEALAAMARVLSEAGVVEGPPVSVLVSVVTPLRLDPDGTEAALVCARHGIPVVATSMPIASVTAPATAAGAVMIAHAEAMALAAVIQAFHPGAPVIYTSYPAFADIRTGSTNYNDTRRGWAAAAAAVMGRLTGLPTFTSGDPFAVMMKPDLMTWGGLRETSTLLVYEQLVMDNEALRRAASYVAPVEVSPETLGVDVVRQVGPGGHFLSQKHTLRHMKEFLVARYAEVEPATEAETLAEARLGARQRAREETRRILDKHRVEPLAAAVELRLEELARRGMSAAA